MAGGLKWTAERWSQKFKKYMNIVVQARDLFPVEIAGNRQSLQDLQSSLSQIGYVQIQELLAFKMFQWCHEGCPDSKAPSNPAHNSFLFSEFEGWVQTFLFLRPTSSHLKIFLWADVEILVLVIMMDKNGDAVGEEYNFICTYIQNWQYNYSTIKTLKQLHW